MKQIIIIFFLVLSFFAKSQKPSDTVNLSKINFELLDSLVLDDVNKERKKYNLQPFIKNNDVCKSSASYQIRYFINYHVISHFNNYPFDNVFLKGPEDRVEFYNKKFKKEYFYLGEICQQKFVFPSKKITYEELSKKILNNYLFSTAHKHTVLFKPYFESTLYGNFVSKSTLDTDNTIIIYNCGVFLHVIH